MNESAAPVVVKLRIPGKWPGPRELVEQLPAEYRLTPETLVLPDGTEVEHSVKPADNQFAKVFRTSCRQPASPSELAIVDSYTFNFCLTGPGGSLAAAQRMMQAGAAIIRAGGAGAFIDNSALAHGGQNWLEMTDDGGPDALSYAFTAVIGGRHEAYTMGMHVLGLRDVVMKRADAQQDEFGIIDVIRYMARSEKPIEDGHILIDLTGPRFHAFVIGNAESHADSPMHNPFGRLKLVSVRDLAERN